MSLLTQQCEFTAKQCHELSDATAFAAGLLERAAKRLRGVETINADLLAACEAIRGSGVRLVTEQGHMANAIEAQVDAAIAKAKAKGPTIQSASTPTKLIEAGQRIMREEAATTEDTESTEGK